MRILKGARCRVISDSHNFFHPGEVVIALEDSFAPYCCLLENYDSNKSIDDYDLNLFRPLCDFELEALDDDWSEK